MNERLKQLMIEAGYAAPEIADRANKLAELIVKECASQCEVIGIVAAQTNTGEMARKTKATADSCGKFIKEHFGVK
jgi:low affinity Fe/Cu permease